ncbi:MAG: hypothetical protein ACPG4Z_03560 [Chitinophagales bacterium]
MLRLLSTNNPTFSFLLCIIIVVVFRLPFIYFDIDLSLWEHNLAPLSQFFVQVVGLELLSNKIFNLSISGFLALFQALILANVFNRKSFFGKETYLLPWVFILLIHCIPFFVVFSPAMVASTLGIAVFGWLLSLDKKRNLIKFIFNISLVVCLSFLIWYPSVALFFFLILVLFLKNVFSFRALLALIIAVFIPFIYMLFYFFMTDNFPDGLPVLFATFDFNNFAVRSPLTNNMIAVTVMVFLLGIISFLSTQQYAKNTIQEVRTQIVLLNLFLLAIALGFWFQTINEAASFIVLIFPLAVYLTTFIHRQKNKKIAEVTHLAVLLSSIAFFTLLILEI